MKIGELIERLQELAEEVGDDAEVRLMTQPNYPFENSIQGACSGAEINGCEEGDEGDDQDGDVEGDDVVYIVEGSQLGYGSKRAWEAC